MSAVQAAAQGFALGAGLIVAIGAQNAFVLRQGLRGVHVLAVCATCAASDAALIALGVGGFGELVRRADGLVVAITWLGAAFLFAYGALAFHRAVRPTALAVKRSGPEGLRVALVTSLALTFLNPHVYLDTILLLGGISARYDGADRVAFGAGAATASFAWFFALGYGARLLVPVFARPAAWRVLDAIVAMVMWILAIGLAGEAVAR